MSNEAKGYSIITEGRQAVIDISNITPSPFNSYGEEAIEDMKGNILACGLITPLTVIGPNEEDNYFILSGERRFKALTQLVAEGYENLRNVPVYIAGIKDMPELEQRLIIESANLETRDDVDKDNHRLNVFRILKQMNESSPDAKHSDIVRQAEKYMGQSERYRKMYLRLIEEDDQDIFQLINEKKLAVSQANKILGLPEEERAEVIEKLNNAEKGNANRIITEIYENKKKQMGGGSTTNTDDNSFEAINDVAQTILNGGDVDHNELFDSFNKLSDETNVSDMEYSQNNYTDYSSYNVNNGVSDESKANTIMKWCEKMMAKSSFEDYEAEAIVMCKRLVEYYDSITE